MTNIKALTRTANEAEAKHAAAVEALTAAEQKLSEVQHEHSDLRTRAGELGTEVTPDQLALSSAVVEHAAAQVEGHRKAERAARAAHVEASADAFAEAARQDLPKLERALWDEVETVALKLRADLARLDGLADRFNARVDEVFDTVKESGTVGHHRRARIEMLERGLDLHHYAGSVVLAVDGDDYRRAPSMDAKVVASIMDKLTAQDEADDAAEWEAELQAMTPDDRAAATWEAMTPQQQHAAEWESQPLFLAQAPVAPSAA